MKIKKATLEDIPGLLILAQEFLAETAWGWKYSPEHSRQTFSNYIESDETAVLFVEVDGAKVGLALVAFDHEFHEERVGYFSKFYISKPARGTLAARTLMDSCVVWFDVHNCKHSFATATANIGNKAFNNLLRKYGYTPCGDTLVRGKNEQS